MPLATVWIPSYNYGRFLPDAIESVLAQTHRELELIVWDDGSTDDSFEIAQRYAADDDRVRVLHHPGRENRGIADTLIEANAAARGAYVCGLAADDTLVADSLERRVAALEADPDATFAYGLIEMIDEDGHPLGEIVGTPPTEIERVYVTTDPLEALLVHNYVPGHSVLFRKSAVESAGGVDARLLYSDWELWMRLLALGPAVFVPGPPVAGHRTHSESLSLAATPDVDLARRLAVFRAIDEKTGPEGIGRLHEPRVGAFAALRRTWHEFAAGYQTEAERALSHAFALDPSLRLDPAYLLWWLGPDQYAGTSAWFRPALARSAASLDAVLREGVVQRHFGSWVVRQLEQLAEPATAEHVGWGMVANELEAAPERWSPTVVWALGRRMFRQPRLLRDAWFVKSILCAIGVWPVVAKLRARS